MDKKFQVFISSTYTDLIEERKTIQEILLMADCIPAGMEAFVTTNDEQFNVIKKVIDLCDYYVLIIGARYGSINEKTGKSYTEMEYDYAVSKEIPVLVFCLDNGVELSKDKSESDPIKLKKLNEFKDKAMKNRLASVWKSMSDLAGQAAISIMKAKTEIERPGWVRADSVGQFDNPELLAQINTLRIENKELTDKLKSIEQEVDNFNRFHSSNIAFDEAPIHLTAKSLNGSSSKTSNLKELFGVISLAMLSGFISPDGVEETICRFVGGTKLHKLTDSTLTAKLINQYRALGLIKVGPVGISLTDLGRKVRDELTIIRNDQ